MSETNKPQEELTTENKLELKTDPVPQPVPESHPVDGAAALFQMYFPLYKNVLWKLSNKQLRRLLSALIEVPLNGKAYKMLEKEERQVYMIADKLLQAKWSMMLYTMVEQDQEAQAKKEQEEKLLMVGDQTTPTTEGE